jgi:hypothetical protein
MPVAELVLLGVAIGLCLLRVGLALVRRRRGARPPSEPGYQYDEPELRLDAPPPQTGSRADAFGELDSTLAADAEALGRARAAGRDPVLGARWPVSRKVAAAAVCVGGAVALPYAHPSLAFLRLLGEGRGGGSLAEAAAAEDAPPAGAGAVLPAASVGEGRLPDETRDQQGRAADLEERAAAAARGPIAQARAEIAGRDEKLRRPIDDPSGRALDRLFAKLARVERGEPGAVARILYFGDSIVASDFITGKLRRLLQERFGDAGHGYALIANAWPGWFHIDVSRRASAEWRVSTCVGPYARDGFYGLGCASFTAYAPGIWTRFATAERNRWGRSVARFDVEYLRQPGGGAIEILVDGVPQGRLETEAPASALARHGVRVPDGPHALELRAADARPVRLFGVSMERDGPGVVLSALGITGARARFVDQQDDAHFAAALRAAEPDLVVLAFGSNEIIDGQLYPVPEYERTLGELMRQVEAAAPEASWMLVGPPDMASKSPAHGHSRPMTPLIVDAQARLAAARGWAFWDQYRAMGGSGSLWAWMQAGLANADMFHPTGVGANMLATWQYHALMAAYERYGSAREDKP